MTPAQKLAKKNAQIANEQLAAKIAEQKKIDEAAKNDKPADEPARTKEPEKKVAKVKVTDLIIKIITDWNMEAESKKALLTAIDTMLHKTTGTKWTAKAEVRDILFAADKKVGISRDQVYAKLCAAHPEMSPMTLAIGLYTILQPTNFKKGGTFGWDVKQLEGGNYIWVAAV